MYVLQWLKKYHLSQKLLSNFSAINLVLCTLISAWLDSDTKLDKRRFQYVQLLGYGAIYLCYFVTHKNWLAHTILSIGYFHPFTHPSLHHLYRLSVKGHGKLKPILRQRHRVYPGQITNLVLPLDVFLFPLPVLYGNGQNWKVILMLFHL